MVAWCVRLAALLEPYIPTLLIPSEPEHTDVDQAFLIFRGHYMSAMML